MKPRSFGRRPQSAAPPPTQASGKPPGPPVMTKFARTGAAPPISANLGISAPPSMDEELRQWKKARGFTFPLRPISVMASLCFGVASIALPAQINDWVQYPLYALSAASLYVGFRRGKSSS